MPNTNKQTASAVRPVGPQSPSGVQGGERKVGGKVEDLSGEKVTKGGEHENKLETEIRKPTVCGMEKCLIAAVAANGAIGRGNRLLWHISEDLKFFRRTTLGCPVIMGRNTWFSIGRPLPGRLNIVVSARGGFEVPEGVMLVPSLEDAYSACGNIAGGNSTPSRCFIIGGAMLYRAAMENADRLFITRIDAGAEDADAFFPDIDPAVWKEENRSEAQRDAETGITFHFVEYGRK